MGGSSHDHDADCPVRHHLAVEEKQFDEAADGLRSALADAPVSFVLVLLFLFVLPAAVGLAVGFSWGGGFGVAVFGLLQVGVFVVAKVITRRPKARSGE